MPGVGPGRPERAVPRPPLSSLLKHRFNLCAGEIPPPDSHLPAVRPDQGGGKRRKEVSHLVFGEVVGDDAVAPLEGLVLRLHPLPGTHILDGETPEEGRSAGHKNPADLGRHGSPARPGQVAGDVDQEDRVERFPAKREAPGIGNGKAGRRRLRAPPGEGDGMGGDVDCGREGGAPDERREGLAVPAAEFQDGGAGGEVRERRRGSAPEVPPPLVVLVPGGCAIGHAANVGAAGG